MGEDVDSPTLLLLQWRLFAHEGGKLMQHAALETLFSRRVNSLDEVQLHGMRLLSSEVMPSLDIDTC